MKNPFKRLSAFELTLLICSSAVCIAAFVIGWAISGKSDALTLISSLTGVLALTFMAKGDVLSQIFTIIFAIFYGVVSFFLRYYGEVITYLGMTAPSAVVALISWLKNPHSSHEVKISPTKPKTVIAIFALSVPVTAAFYFILRALGNANLLISTISVTTSFIAASLSIVRSPYYAVAYAANDVVLIVLWSMACANSLTYLPMVLNFVAFLFNDAYGFVNWKRIYRAQSLSASLTENGDDVDRQTMT